MGTKTAPITNRTRDVHEVAQRLSLGKEVLMSGAKKAKKSAVKISAGSAIKLARSADVLHLYRSDHQVVRLIEILGNNLLATMLGVNQSQPSMWNSGKERVSAENQRKISDLDHVMNRLLIELHPDQAVQWLQGNNPHLNFGRPMDVLILKGPSRVLDAIDALASGSYA